MFNIKRFVDYYILKRPVRLRHVVRYGSELEEKGGEFYRMLGKKAAEKDVQEICAQLVLDEIEHKKVLDGILASWLPVNEEPDESAQWFFETEKERWGLFRNPPDSEASAKEMIRYAIDQEKRMKRFYGSIGARFDDEWKRSKVLELAREEGKHEEKLRKLYRSLR